MCVAFLGPTLLDLECRLESLLSTMSWIFFSQALFTLIGAACGGFLAQKCCHSILLLASSIMICITLAIIPFCTVLFWLSVVLAFMGFFMGTIDTVANIAMIELYGRNVAPFLQALHFCYGLGAFVSPLVAKPFLLNKDCSELVQAATLPNLTLPNQNLHSRKANLTDPFQEISYAQKNSNIENAFWILAAIQTPVIILLSVLVAKDFFGWNNRYDLTTPGFVETKEGIEMNRASISRNSIPAAASEDRPLVSKQQLISTCWINGCHFVHL
ncbi:Major facilitator superfamily domain-containing protein 4A [Armadillidium nasatum]|uniref:Major facilitator superfamily domain-containing protein 4A n=1 Tax=Armadillidium nasatum TaxID=96803 RepID=A0A5N5TCL3_9CRUS|nr:Major facilitator superfamily domain-containing protein 4A [Armadillidium nasatum]